MPEVLTNTVHIIDAVSQSVSKDGTTALFVFMVAGEKPDDPPRKFGFTMPAHFVRSLMGVVHAMVLNIEKAGKQPGQNIFQFPMQFSIGNSDELDKMTVKLPNGDVMPQGPKVVISFDWGTPAEMNFVMMTMAGWEMGNSLHQNIAPRLTAEQRAQMKNIKPQQPTVVTRQGR